MSVFNESVKKSKKIERSPIRDRKIFQIVKIQKGRKDSIDSVANSVLKDSVFSKNQQDIIDPLVCNFEPLKNALQEEMIARLINEFKILPNMFVKITKGKNFNTDLISYIGPIPQTKEFFVYHFKHAESDGKQGLESKRLYLCSFINCTCIFENIYNLFNHIRYHSDEKPFLCSFGCGKSFSQTGNRKKHEEHIHIRSKVYKCQVCNIDYKYKYNLLQHNKKWHNQISR